MATDTNLRKEIQALRNQAKARGHENITTEEEIRQKAFIQNAKRNTHAYVYNDLLKTGLFLLFALLFLFGASIKLSSIDLFTQIRSQLHIAQSSF